jgi:hypothetical protein
MKMAQPVLARQMHHSAPAHAAIFPSSKFVHPTVPGCRVHQGGCLPVCVCACTRLTALLLCSKVLERLGGCHSSARSKTTQVVTQGVVVGRTILVVLHLQSSHSLAVAIAAPGIPHHMLAAMTAPLPRIRTCIHTFPTAVTRTRMHAMNPCCARATGPAEALQ